VDPLFSSTIGTEEREDNVDFDEMSYESLIQPNVSIDPELALAGFPSSSVPQNPDFGQRKSEL
jgi:hypothetical protein